MSAAHELLTELLADAHLEESKLRYGRDRWAEEGTAYDIELDVVEAMSDYLISVIQDRDAERKHYASVPF